MLCEYFSSDLMPIVYRIDHEKRIVIARAFGTLIDDDVFSYQREVWSGQDVVGYDELVDMTDVEEIEVPSVRRIQDLASVAARMDLVSAPSRFAIVAPGDRAYALGMMFQGFRDREQRSTKDVGVFRTVVEALRFLRIDELPALPSRVMPE
jgi:hypothetical protein